MRIRDLDIQSSLVSLLLAICVTRRIDIQGLGQLEDDEEGSKASRLIFELGHEVMQSPQSDDHRSICLSCERGASRRTRYGVQSKVWPTNPSLSFQRRLALAWVRSRVSLDRITEESCRPTLSSANGAASSFASWASLR